ncbi:MAG: MFS transporter [Candidatus Hodarchaeota archaeon]
MVALGPIILFTIMMSSTFYMIFVADTLGGGPGQFMDGLALIGVLVVIQMVVQTLLDYPTGSLGDMIGHRYVIASAYLIYGVVFYLTSILTPDTSILIFVLIYVLWGLAFSQESGAWDAWFDNNYRVAAPDDMERKEYGVFLGRLGMIATAISMAALIPGGILAVIFSRMWVFQLSAILCVATAIAVLILVKDFPEVEEMREERPSFSEYYALLKSGASFIVSDPFVKYVLIGGMIAWSTIIVWGELLVFPLLFAYLVTDVAVATFRTLLRVPGMFTQERAGVWSQRFKPEEWIPRFRLIQNCGFACFFIFAAIMYVFDPIAGSATLVDIVVPLTDFVIMQVPQESVLPVILMFVTFVVGGFFFAVADILTMRLMIDIVPDRIRNSVYSLSPTMAIVFAIPQIAIFGAAIQYIGFPVTLAITGLISLVGVLMIRKGLSFPIPITEERKRAKEEALAEQELTLVEKAAIDEGEKNPSEE